MSIDNKSQTLANQITKKAQEIATSVYFERAENALRELDEIVKMATELHKSITLWNCRFDDGESA